VAAKWRGASFLARANVIGAGHSGQQYFGRYRSPPARGWRFSPSFGAVTQSGVVVFRGVNHLTAEPPLRGHNRRAMPKPSLGNHPSINQRRLPMMTFNSCRSFCGAPSQSSPAANRLTCQGVVVGGSCEHARHPGARTSGGPGMARRKSAIGSARTGNCREAGSGEPPFTFLRSLPCRVGGARAPRPQVIDIPGSALRILRLALQDAGDGRAPGG